MTEDKASGVVAIGTETYWGRVAAVGWITGERYYWMVDDGGGVAMIDAITVEASHD